MPIAVFPHLDFESLIEALGGLERPSEPVLQPVVIPSLPFSDYLQRRIADRFGVCMGLEFLMPQDFVHLAVGPGRESPWSTRHLVWRVFPHVSEFASKLGVAKPSSRDRFALAGLLADRLDQYGHFRPELIRCWAKGAAGTTSDQEAWQRDLWGKLRSEIEVTHPALKLAELPLDADYCQRLAEQYPKLLVLGTGALDPLLVEVLEILAGAGSEVNVHVVLPSLGYLGDLRKHGKLPAESVDPESIDAPAGHPLLESLGRHAVGSFLLLGKLDEQYTHWPEPDGDEAETHSLLSRIQSDLRALRAPQSGTAESHDTSLRVHSCFGARREMEVLRDELFRAFDDLTDLQPHEVHVVTPDLETYAPLVSAVLRQGETPLPVRLSELPPSEIDPVVDGIFTLLEMAHGGRFEAADVLELLQKPVVFSALGVSEAENLRRWVRDSGLTHGLGETSPGKARFARNRLMAGRFFSAESPARYPDGTFVLPVADQLGGEIELRGRFHLWLAELEEAMQEWTELASASEWADRLRTASRDLLGGANDDSGLEALPAIAFLAGMECQEPLDAGAVLDWMRTECSGSARRVGVSGKIAFGRFKQLQNLPCRVLAMVGMQDANFPARNRTPAWDLLRQDPRVWDRNPRLDDRQLFLDALLTPADRLIITSSTRNVRTQKSEPFSSCVDELLRVVETMGAGRPVIEQRLQPFVEAYFRGEDLPRSYDDFHAKVAEKIRGVDRTGCPFWKGDPPSEPAEDRGEISIMQLATFWKDPAKAFVKACGIALTSEETADEELNRSPLSLDTLGTWGLKNSVLEEMLTATPNLELLEAKSGATRQLPPGDLGKTSWNQGQHLAAPMGASIKKLRGETTALECVVAGGVRVTGELLSVQDGSAWLDYRVGEMKKPKHFLASWMAALLAGASGSDRPTLLFDETHPKTPNELAAIPAEEAKAVLNALVAGYLAGQGRPLCFALETSDELIKKLIGKNGDPVTAIEAAEKKWSAEDRGHGGGEGLNPAARLAWRDQDPFANREEWMALAEAVSAPLQTWGGFK